MHDGDDGRGPILERVWADIRQIPRRIYHNVRLMSYAMTGADNDPSLHQYLQGPDDEATIKRINNRREALVRERAGLRLWRTLIVVGSAGTPVLFLLTVPKWDGSTVTSLHWVLAACLVFAQFFLLVALLFVRARVASLNAQLQLLEYENVLTSFQRDHERRAANLFFKHQVELKQYYDQTLRQNKQSFVVGIICVAFGLCAIVAVATLLLVHSDSATPAKLAAGGLGILSVLLTGFVARIYLRVYEGSATALGSFHDRLVNTNDYHFASLLISMIGPESDRMEGLSELARSISSRRVTTEAEL
jgi:hypothetical protein